MSERFKDGGKLVVGREVMTNGYTHRRDGDYGMETVEGHLVSTSDICRGILRVVAVDTRVTIGCEECAYRLRI